MKVFGRPCRPQQNHVRVGKRYPAAVRKGLCAGGCRTLRLQILHQRGQPVVGQLLLKQRDTMVFLRVCSLRGRAAPRVFALNHDRKFLRWRLGV